ncbi:MAG TPA: FAD-dependent oxidoreductase [Candidatus Ornithomonoglobus intestinigallinarum]|uniref:FAD-dependent oxidoreductase n=1 Tax=Candidatus Ornithomonoglobus intestinigallinarum TaxID=2840894 RepID=A0A9D1H103_9FIRM|nr:FAD-dependent oxidoreductase [Candidatus Ornithomonoglobus intestinigallinarum]
MRKKYDIIVCGGGFAGSAAAIAAARSGASVLLIEKSGFLGGAAGNCLVNPFMPFTTTIDGQYVRLSAGIFSDIIDLLGEMGALAADGVVFNGEILKLILDRLVSGSGTGVIFHTRIISAEKENGAVKSLRCVNASGESEYFADVFIDATGDANVAAMAGCPFMLGREGDNLCQPMTLCFDLANVDVDRAFKDKKAINALYAEKRESGEIKNPRGDILYMRHAAKDVLHINSTRIIKKSPVNAEDLSFAEREAREQMYELYMFLKNNFDAFKNSVLLASGPEIGIRESRRIDGMYTLTTEDLKACVKFDDGIAACNYDIDIHDPAGSGTSHYYFKEGTYYTIPYRCLVPKKADNLLVAGRCISGTHEAQASFRIMPVCCTLGEAAGTAAALALKSGSAVGNIDTDELRAVLKNNGAFL